MWGGTCDCHRDMGRALLALSMGDPDASVQRIVLSKVPLVPLIDFSMVTSRSEMIIKDFQISRYPIVFHGKTGRDSLTFLLLLGAPVT